MNREKTIWVGRSPSIEYLQKSKDRYYRSHQRLNEIWQALAQCIPSFIPNKAIETPWLGLNTSWETYTRCLDQEELKKKLKKIEAQKLNALGKYEAARDMLYETTGITAAAASEEL